MECYVFLDIQELCLNIILIFILLNNYFYYDYEINENDAVFVEE